MFGMGHNVIKGYKTKPCGCSFCNDLRNIEPAKYIGGGGADVLKAFIKEAACFTLSSRRRFNIT